MLLQRASEIDGTSIRFLDSLIQLVLFRSRIGRIEVEHARGLSSQNSGEQECGEPHRTSELHWFFYCPAAVAGSCARICCANVAARSRAMCI